MDESANPDNDESNMSGLLEPEEEESTPSIILTTTTTATTASDATANTIKSATSVSSSHGRTLAELLDLENISTHNLYLGFERAPSTVASASSSILAADGESSQDEADDNHHNDDADDDANDGEERASGDPKVRTVDYGSLDRYGFLIVDDGSGAGGRIASVAGATSTSTSTSAVSTAGRQSPSSFVQRLLSIGTASKFSFITDNSQSQQHGKKLTVVDSTLTDGGGGGGGEWKKEREARRALKWVKMLNRLMENNNSKSNNNIRVYTWPQAHRKFEERLIKGIPDCLRTRVWSIFLGASGSGSDSVDNDPTMDVSYRDLYLRISGFERQIDLDIERTLRDHVMFKMRFSSAQISLFKMLVAYSNLDPAVGYCQGMSNVAAFLLLYFDEESAFGLFVRLLARDGLRMLYMSGFGLLFEAFFIQERLMAKLTPNLEARLSHLGIGPSVYATKWYLTLFLSFPVSLSNRIWDLFLFLGFDWLIVVAVALLRYHETTLMALDYEPAMQFLSHLPEQPIHETRLIRLAMRIWHRLTDDDGGGGGGGLSYYHPSGATGPAVALDRPPSVFDRLRKAYSLLLQQKKGKVNHHQ